MKIWIKEESTQTYTNVKLHCEEHSDFNYLGDLDDEEFRNFLLEFQPDIDVEKNVKLIKYYGYLHLFIIKKN